MKISAEMIEDGRIPVSPALQALGVAIIKGYMERYGVSEVTFYRDEEDGQHTMFVKYDKPRTIGGAVAFPHAGPSHL